MIFPGGAYSSEKADTNSERRLARDGHTIRYQAVNVSLDACRYGKRERWHCTPSPVSDTTHGRSSYNYTGLGMFAGPILPPLNPDVILLQNEIMKHKRFHPPPFLFVFWL